MPTQTERKITTPSENDVLCGRGGGGGGGSTSHTGNRRFRDFVGVYQNEYLKAKKKDKEDIARMIIHIIRHGGGKFLKKKKFVVADDDDNCSEYWVEIGKDEAIAKTCQALREANVNRLNVMKRVSQLDVDRVVSLNRSVDGLGERANVSYASDDDSGSDDDGDDDDDDENDDDEEEEEENVKEDDDEGDDDEESADENAGVSVDSGDENDADDDNDIKNDGNDGNVEDSDDADSVKHHANTRKRKKTSQPIEKFTSKERECLKRVPGDNDVLCGRGGATNQYIGNKRFRAVVANFLTEYFSAKKYQKMDVALRIVQIIKNRGGKFLERGDSNSTRKKAAARKRAAAGLGSFIENVSDDDDGDGREYWVEIPDRKALTKTSQTFRDVKERTGMNATTEDQASHPDDSVEPNFPDSIGHEQ